MSLPRHPQVAGWLQNLDDTTRGDVDESLDYLQEHVGQRRCPTCATASRSLGTSPT